MPSPEALRGEPGSETEWVAIAFIQTTHGRRGEVSADPLTDFPERFRPGLQVMVGAGERQRPLCVEAVRFHKGRVLLKFEGVDSIAEAETLRGASVQVPRSERVTLPDGRIYVSDLIGCSVVEQDEVLGKVVGWEETGAVPLLRVDCAGEELLIPFTPAICYSVDSVNKQILVHTPEGLRELNPAAAPSHKSSRRKKR
ncbi:MAG: 16S rRNA processing protein RimM [Acidobacteria bacterium]|nr:16S rRNA processing protein RimM [Acidobacteriota bacterium]